MPLIIEESYSSKYGPRTEENARKAATTIAFAFDMSTAGEQLTMRVAGVRYLGLELPKNRQIDVLDLSRKVFKKLKVSQNTSINIAGNGIYTLKRFNVDQAWINQLVYEVLAQVHHHLPIQSIRSGGQTGVDIAGAVAGYKLGIPTTVHMPQGFIQRFEKNTDVAQSEAAIVQQIVHGAERLKEYVPVTK